MKLRYSIGILILLTFCLSCRIEKRHYMKGYDVSFYHHYKNTNPNNITKITPPKVKSIENNVSVLSIDTFIKKETKIYYADANKRIFVSKIIPLMKEWKVVLNGDSLKKETTKSMLNDAINLKEKRKSIFSLILGISSLLFLIISFGSLGATLLSVFLILTFILAFATLFIRNKKITNNDNTRIIVSKVVAILTLIVFLMLHLFLPLLKVYSL